MKRVLFVCEDNRSLSQIAEAYARVDASAELEAYSAGLRPADSLDPRAIELMDEVGCDLRRHAPKPLAELADMHFDAVVCLGAHLDLQVRSGWSGHWRLPEADSLSLDQLRGLRDRIGERVQALLGALEAGGLDGRELSDLV